MNSAGSITREKARFLLTLPSTAAKPDATGVKLGHAVKRNFVRRRIRELYRTNESKFTPGYDIVVVARTRAIFARYSELERSFLQLMKKLGLTLPEEGKG